MAHLAPSGDEKAGPFLQSANDLLEHVRTLDTNVPLGVAAKAARTLAHARRAQPLAALRRLRTWRRTRPRAYKARGHV